VTYIQTARQLQQIASQDQTFQEEWKALVLAALQFTSRHRPVAMREHRNEGLTSRERDALQELCNAFIRQREVLEGVLYRKNYICAPFDPYDISDLYPA